MSPIVEVAAVCKSFGTVSVLEGVSFQVRPGAVVAIIGRSGSGKSTALRCIDRLETIDAGQHQGLRPRRHVAEARPDRLRRDVGIVFQSYNLFPHLTAEENITLAPRLVLKLPRAEARELARTRAGAGGPGGQGAGLSGAAFGRPAAARGHRALAGDGAAGDAVRRSHVGARPASSPARC